jgi:hypothetical protein
MRIFAMAIMALLLAVASNAQAATSTPEQVQAVVETLSPYKQDYLAKETKINLLGKDRVLGLLSGEKDGTKVLGVHVTIDDYDQETKTYYSCYLNMIDFSLDGIVDAATMHCYTGTDALQTKKIDETFTSTFFETVGDPQDLYDTVINEALK